MPVCYFYSKACLLNIYFIVKNCLCFLSSFYWTKKSSISYNIYDIYRNVLAYSFFFKTRGPLCLQWSQINDIICIIFGQQFLRRHEFFSTNSIYLYLQHTQMHTGIFFYTKNAILTVLLAIFIYTMPMKRSLTEN